MKKKKKFKANFKSEVSTIAPAKPINVRPIRPPVKEYKEYVEDSGFNIATIKDVFTLLRANFPIILIILVISFAVYWQIVRGEFVNIDDLAGIVQNPNIRSITTAWKTGNIYQVYSAVLFKMFGLSSTAFHVAAIILHAVCCVLVFVVSFMLFGKKVAIIATSLFVVNPTGSEAINWLSASGYIHQAILIFSMLILFILYRRSGKVYYAAATSIIFALDIFLYKTPWVLVTPFILFTVDTMLLRTKFSKKFIPVYIFFVVLSLVFTYTTVVKSYENRAFTLETQHYLDLKKATPYLNRIPYSLFMMVRQYVYPERLTIYHEGLIIGNAEYSFMVVSTLIYIVICFALLKKHEDYLALLLLMPISELPSYSPVAIAWLVADRYLYLGAVFFCLLLAKIFVDLEKHFKLRNFANILCAIFFIIYFTRTAVRAVDFKNSKNLWLATMKTSPLSYRVYNNLGDVYASEGKYKLALENFQKSLELKPDYADAVHNMGYTYMQMGDLENAKKALILSYQMNPRLYQSLFKLGYIEYQQGNIEKAKEYLTKVLEINPGNMDALQLLQVIQNQEQKATQ